MMKAPKIKKVPCDLKPHKLSEVAWYYREKTYFDVYVHSAAGTIINFRIPYRMVLK